MDYPLKDKETFELIQWILDPKVIDGALRSAIHAHGPITTGSRKIKIVEEGPTGEQLVSEITTCSTSSASKRIRGAIRTRVTEYLQKKEKERAAEKWYNRLWPLKLKKSG